MLFIPLKARTWPCFIGRCVSRWVQRKIAHRRSDFLPCPVTRVRTIANTQVMPTPNIKVHCKARVCREHRPTPQLLHVLYADPVPLR